MERLCQRNVYVPYPFPNPWACSAYVRYQFFSSEATVFTLGYLLATVDAPVATQSVSTSSRRVCVQGEIFDHRLFTISSQLFSKMQVTQEVLVVSGPGEDDGEDGVNGETVVVERTWDGGVPLLHGAQPNMTPSPSAFSMLSANPNPGSLQYLIAISGRCFCIGGVIPIELTLMPLDKVRVHRLGVTLERGSFSSTAFLFTYFSLSLKQRKLNITHNSSVWRAPILCYLYHSYL